MSIGSRVRWASADVAAAEALERDVHAHEAQRGHVQADPLVVGGHRRRADLQHQPLRREAGARAAPCSTSATSVPVGRVAGRHLEADVASARRRRAGRRDGGARLLQRPAHQLTDQPGAVGERQELRRRDLAELGVPPAQLRLDAGDPLLLERDDRLEQEEQLVAGAGAPAGRRAAGPAGRRPRRGTGSYRRGGAGGRPRARRARRGRPGRAASSTPSSALDGDQADARRSGR